MIMGVLTLDPQAPTAGRLIIEGIEETVKLGEVEYSPGRMRGRRDRRRRW